eukprot:4797420-Pyramimonas_sp.AAC.1
MAGAVETANQITATYGVTIVSINIISATPADSDLQAGPPPPDLPPQIYFMHVRMCYTHGIPPGHTPHRVLHIWHPSRAHPSPSVTHMSSLQGAPLTVCYTYVTLDAGGTGQGRGGVGGGGTGGDHCTRPGQGGPHHRTDSYIYETLISNLLRVKNILGGKGRGSTTRNKVSVIESSWSAMDKHDLVCVWEAKFDILDRNANLISCRRPPALTAKDVLVSTTKERARKWVEPICRSSEMLSSFYTASTLQPYRPVGVRRCYLASTRLLHYNPTDL